MRVNGSTKKYHIWMMKRRDDNGGDTIADITVPNWSWEDQIIGIGLERGYFPVNRLY
jgi:hypothetical protein